MTKYNTHPISHAQREFIEIQVFAINKLLERTENTMLMYEQKDFPNLQKLVDNGLINKESYQPLSIAFGDIFIAENPQYKWVSVPFIHRPRLGIFSKSDNTIWYPIEQFAKWKHRHLKIDPIYKDLSNHLLSKSVNNPDNNSK